MRILLYLIIALTVASCAHKQEEADLVVHNATIYLVDKNFRTAKAMAIVDGKIVEIGAERQIMNKYRADEVVDAANRAIIPELLTKKDPVAAINQLINDRNNGIETPQDAIFQLTLVQARKEILDDVQGKLAKGYEASFYILSMDPIRYPEGIRELRIAESFKEGERVK